MCARRTLLIVNQSQTLDLKDFQHNKQQQAMQCQHPNVEIYDDDYTFWIHSLLRYTLLAESMYACGQTFQT
eukprot:m.177540 g.177540  ORF g.177540 m.177540 type:complete len:71 (+) comp14632_c0_seq57:4419-4631(+)